MENTSTPEQKTRKASPELRKGLGDVALSVSTDHDPHVGDEETSLADRIRSRTPEERAANLQKGLTLMLDEHRRDPTFFDDHRRLREQDQKARDDHGYRYRRWED